RSVRGPRGSARQARASSRGSGSRAAWLARSGGRLHSWRPLRDEIAPEGQVREPRALERIHGVLGRSDERLAVKVERRVEHGADAGARLELAEHPVVGRVPGLVHDVSARRRVVGVNRGDDLVAPLRGGGARSRRRRAPSPSASSPPGPGDAGPRARGGGATPCRANGSTYRRYAAPTAWASPPREGKTKGSPPHGSWASSMFALTF